MDIFKGAERLMGMTDAVWARHANPLSAYTRFIGGVAIFFVLWSVYWIGWRAIAPIALAAAWTWLNPRLFPPPKTTTSWATKGVPGERAYLNRASVPIPDGHDRSAAITTGFAIFFMSICVLGFATRSFWAAFAGWHAAMLSKMWFVDRMVWLWEQMEDAHPVYRAWARAEWDASIT